MEIKNLFQSYGYFLDAIQVLSEMSLIKNPTYIELGLSKTQIQKAYRDIDRLKNTISFEGEIVNYLAYLGSEFYLFDMLNNFRDEINYNFISFLKIYKHKKDRLIKRIFFREPAFVLNSKYYKEIKELCRDKNFDKKFMINLSLELLAKSNPS